MDKYKNTYRIPSARAAWWHYGWAGAYFITICTKNREHIFGEIHNGTMHLSPMGVLADVLWHEIPHHFANLELGAFVVMPNHIHGIIILNNNNNNDIDIDNDNNDNDNDNVETRHALSLQSQQPQRSQQPQSTQSTQQWEQTIAQKRFQNQGKNTISSIVGAYKSAVTKHANRLGLPNGWQPRFHDHIIRNDAEYERISYYIISNPLNWENDKFYK
ncbi:MAG: hypothetical protein WHS63_01080 [Tenuifilum sp.]|uniref:transposase n=1 Tax=Tenuifilum sp. TaxID=2760880 RepID=UPI0030A0F993